MAKAIPSVFQLEPGFIHTQDPTPPNFPESGLEGCVGSLGFTQWGPEKLTLITGGLGQFKEVFGDSISDTFPTADYLKYMFDNSALNGRFAPLFFKRVFHYDDINDATTITAAKAEGAIYDGEPTPAVIGEAVMAGTGDDTLVSSGTYTGTLNGTYEVEVTTAGVDYAASELTLYFTPDGGDRTELGNVVPISGDTVEIEKGVKFTLTDGGDTTLTMGDKWSIDVTAQGRTEGDIRIKVYGKYFGALGNTISVKAVAPENGVTGDFGLEVYVDGTKKETYQDLSVEVDSPNYFEPTINMQSNYIIVEDTDNVQDVGIDSTLGVGELLSGGSDGDEPVLDDYIGSLTTSAGLHGFSETRYPVRIICPDAIVGTVPYIDYFRATDAYIKGFNARASQHLAVPKNFETEAGITAWFNNNVQLDTEFGFMYFGYVRDSVTGKWVDPTCAITGLSSKTARDRSGAGVWTNYAGESFTLVGFDAVHKSFTSDVNGKLNELGINVIKVEPGVGVVLNGCRTMTKTKKRDYKYIAQVLNTQDCAYLVENSLKWVKFKNLSDGLYANMYSSVDSVLSARNREGGFNTEDGAPYEIQCNNGMQTQEMKNKGLALLKWGIRNRFCAEFVWLHFTNMTSGASL